MWTDFYRVSATAILLSIGALIGYACSEAIPLVQTSQALADEPGPGRSARAKKKVQRFGNVIGLKKEKQFIYDMLHAHPWAPINEMLKECNIQNYSIYETQFDGKLYLFSYFEYTGENFKADMAKMAKNKATQEWWKLTDPCQQRLPGTPEGEQWLGMREVYHLD